MGNCFDARGIMRKAKFRSGYEALSWWYFVFSGGGGFNFVRVGWKKSCYASVC